MQHKARLESWESRIQKLSEQTAGDRHLLLVERTHPSEIKAGVCRTKQSYTINV